MNTLSRILPALLLLASTAAAGTIYRVTIDTSTINGLSGGLYLQFSPGLNADPATLAFTNFTLTPGGSPPSNPAPISSPAVSGTLDASNLLIPNTDANNDYLHFLTFGNLLEFDVDFQLPNTLIGDAGSTFLFALTASDGLTPILVTDPFNDYYQGQIDYSQIGAFSPTPLTIYTNISLAPTPGIPEPSTGLLLFGAITAIFLRRRQQN